MSKQQTATPVKEYDNTNSGFLSPGKDSNRVSGNVNIAGTEYRLNAEIGEGGKIEGSLETKQSKDFNPFTSAPSKAVGTFSIKPVTQSTEKAPSFKGVSIIGDNAYRISGWRRITKSGNNIGKPFIALSVQTEASFQAFKAQASASSTPVEKGATVTVNV